MKRLIIDTDIGEDIDDIWAISLILSTNMFKIDMFSISQGDVEYKTKLIAKILFELNIDNIAICKGVSTNLNNAIHPQKEWIKDFDLHKFGGKIYSNYEEGYRQVLMANPNDEFVVVALSPFTSLARITTILKNKKVSIVAMAGSIYSGYFGKTSPDSECNIVSDIEASREIISSGLNVLLLPLDVCNNIVLDGENYELIKHSHNPFARIVMENYYIWQKDYIGGARKLDINKSTSILYDFAPIWYLIFPQNFDVIDVPLTITNDGLTVIGGVDKVQVALKLHKLEMMKRFSSESLCTKHERNYDLKIMGIEGKYKLIYTQRRNSMFISVYETGWENKRCGSSYGPSRREYYIMHLVTKGKGKFVVGDKTYNVSKGDCFLLPPNIMTYYEADKIDPFSYYWVGFGGMEAAELMKKVGFLTNDNYVVRPAGYEAILQRLKDMTNLQTKEGSAEYVLIGELYLILAEMMIERTTTEVSNREYIDKSLQYMNLNYQKGISVNDVADYIGIERTYFFRLFKKQMGMSPQDYLINLKMEKTKVLLKDSKKSIKEIAYSVGYTNYVSFVKIFKEKTGVSPSEFRCLNR